MKKILFLIIFLVPISSNALDCSLTQETEYCSGANCSASAETAITATFSASYPNSSNNEYRIISISQIGGSTNFSNFSLSYENRNLVSLNPDTWSEWQSHNRTYAVSSSCVDCEINLLTGTCSDSICEDGFPVIAAGYTHCDRLPLKQCDDGSIILASANCPISYLNQNCNSLETCETWAHTQLTCNTSDLFTFNYTDPDNMNFSCSTDSTVNNNGSGTSTDHTQVVERLDVIIDKHNSLGTSTRETTHAVNVMNTDLKTKLDTINQSIGNMSNKLDTNMPTGENGMPTPSQEFAVTADEVVAKKLEFIESLNTKKEQFSALLDIENISFQGSFPDMSLNILNTTLTLDRTWIDYILAFLGVLVVLFAYYDGLIILLGG